MIPETDAYDTAIHRRVLSAALAAATPREIEGDEEYFESSNAVRSVFSTASILSQSFCAGSEECGRVKLGEEAAVTATNLLDSLYSAKCV